MFICAIIVEKSLGLSVLPSNSIWRGSAVLKNALYQRGWKVAETPVGSEYSYDSCHAYVKTAKESGSEGARGFPIC